MRTAFVKKISELMRQDERVVTITADMGFSVFEELQKEFPKRFINSGVTEQSSVGVAAGLALTGHKVFFYAQAPFATMRCFEQVRLDIAYNNLDVKVVGVASGFSSNQLGVSHFATEDIGLMRMLPNMTVFNPGDPIEAEFVTSEAYKLTTPCYIRITKAGSPTIHTHSTNLQFGKGITLREGSEVLVVVSGNLLPYAVEVVNTLEKENTNATLLSFPTVKPFDEELLLHYTESIKKVVTIEDHFIHGGLGTVVSEIIARRGNGAKLLSLGIPDKFTSITGTPTFLLDYNGLSPEKMVQEIRKFTKN